MERLITVRDVKERYGCSNPTARKYIRQCNPHLENPLAAPEWAFREWEQKRTVFEPKRMTRAEYESLADRLRNPRVIVPRRR